MSKIWNSGKIYRKIMKKIVGILSVSFCFVLSSCVFRYDLTGKTKEQGNLLPDSKISRLHKGLKKQEVEAIMGTPLISPTFRNDRWDYTYTLQKANKPVYIKTVILYFRGDRLVSIEQQHKKVGRDLFTWKEFKNQLFDKG